MGICFLQIIFDIQVEEIDKAKKNFCTRQNVPFFDLLIFA